MAPKHLEGNEPGKPDFIHVQFENTFDFIHKEVLDEIDWPDLAEVIAQRYSNNDRDLFPYVVALPIVACCAVGGSPMQAVPLAASWALYYLAAIIFDDIQDSDKHSSPWNAWSAPHAMNVGLGVLFSAQSCLAKLAAPPEVSADILDSLSRNFRLAALGQNRDPRIPTVEAYFTRIISNTGMLFAAISSAGARLHTGRRQDVQNMYDCGMALGVLGQIRDDCNDVGGSDFAKGYYTLPVLHALSQTDHPKHPRLKSLVANRRPEQAVDDTAELHEILDDMNAMAYSMAVAHVYKDKALVALREYPKEVVRHIERYATELCPDF